MQIEAPRTVWNDASEGQFDTPYHQLDTLIEFLQNLAMEESKNGNVGALRKVTWVLHPCSEKPGYV